MERVIRGKNETSICINIHLGGIREINSSKLRRSLRKICLGILTNRLTVDERFRWNFCPDVTNSANIFWIRDGRVHGRLRRKLGCCFRTCFHIRRKKYWKLGSKYQGVGSKIYSFKNYSTADCIKHFGTRKVLKLLWAVQRDQKQYRFVILSQRSKQTLYQLL